MYPHKDGKLKMHIPKGAMPRQAMRVQSGHKYGAREGGIEEMKRRGNEGKGGGEGERQRFRV